MTKETKEIHPLKLKVIKKYSNLSKVDLLLLPKESEAADEVFSRLIVDLTNAVMHIEVAIEDIEVVCSLLPTLFVVSKKEYSVVFNRKNR